MNATLPAVDHTLPSAPAPDPDAGTRQRVLQIIAAAGPVSAAELAAQLDLAPAGIRRHLGVLEVTDQIAVHDAANGPKGRGRPARRYVVTNRGQSALSHRYAELATQALRFLAETAGAQAVQGFAEQRVRELEQRHAEAVAAAGPDVAARVQVLADGLAADGYAATARPAPGGAAMQLCQGHCPVQDVAHEFPQLCEAEARAFSRLLGVHVQRLSTLAGGGHVCTTNIPISNGPHMNASAHPVLSVEGHQA
ncbi:helix-turn-helix transcriptional regulator [Cellulomonas sp.]|uniref:helix-turn-helix transcriptional regulator n=1 Tax=Cellulomonas sp. TaxID=40001 RepID=UPI003BAD4648